MEDDRVSDNELLVARGNKRCEEICRWMQCLSENEKQNKDTSREADGK